MCLLYFLHKNGKWLYISNDRLYMFAKHVAGSRPQKRGTVIQNIQDFLTASIKNLISDPLLPFSERDPNVL